MMDAAGIRERGSEPCAGTERERLQHELGELGRVLPRLARGTLAQPAQGWYAEIDGELVFLGDHVAIAYATIGRLLTEAGPRKAKR